MKEIGQLTGSVKHYDWGGRRFIPLILGEKEADKPCAEYWLGVHPQAQCKLTTSDGAQVLLQDYIAADPNGTVGPVVQKQFGTIPYLLKALDVKDMLSIQVHPSRSAAIEDFAKEEAAGIPLTDPTRNYKDQNHKPELAVAMGDFWLLHGFKPEPEMKAVLQRVPELNFLASTFADQGYEAVYRQVMNLGQEEVSRILEPLLDRIIPLYNAGELSKASEDFWAARAALTFSRTDRGIFSVYLFNVLNMKKGEAIFQDAGMPHAYLEGWNVEIMASSDNVLRGGLTTKHIDVPELLKHTRCEATHPKILKGEWEGSFVRYPTPAPDFELGGFSLKAAEEASFTAVTADILMLVEGSASLVHGSTELELKAGAPAAIVFTGTTATLKAGPQGALVYKATVPA